MLLTGITAAALIAAVIFCVLTACSVWAAALVFVGAWVVLAVLALVFLIVLANRVDLEKEQTEDNKFYRTVMRIYIQALKTLVIRVHAVGLEKIPTQGRFMLV